MNCVIYYRDKWESFWLRCMFLLLLLALFFLFIFSHHFMPLLVSGEFKIASLREGDEVLCIVAIFSLIFFSFFVTTFFGKEKWYFDDNAICVACSTFGIVFKKRKWELSNILEVQYNFVPKHSCEINMSFSRVVHEMECESYYEIYFVLADKRKSIRVLWSGCPEPAEKVYAFIKDCQINRFFENIEVK